MKKEISSSNNHFGHRGQAIVEFAIALPVLLMLLVGIMEVGRLLFMYTMVSNASRDAVRYASAVGLDATGQYEKYAYCSGIKQAAKDSGYFVNLQDTDITISYDRNLNVSSPLVSGGCNASSGEDADVTAIVDSEDRVTVTVSKAYDPLIKLIPIPSRIITSTSSRTILGIFELDN
jgi:Flp pilus assembly protein TadG